MLILAFETSAKAASVALLDNGMLLAESYQNSGQTHSATLLKMAQDLLASCGRAVSDVDAVAVAAGPGSFTGVRIGVSAAKGFAWGRELPCYGVSTLESMALGSGICSGIICPVMDARRSQVYNALFLAEGGRLHRLTPDRAISLSDLETEIENCKNPVFLVGDGAVLCYNTLGDFEGKVHLAAEHCRQQRAAGVALAAALAAGRGEPANGAELIPNYLRLSQAERERLERLNSIEK